MCWWHNRKRVFCQIRGDQRAQTSRSVVAGRRDTRDGRGLTCCAGLTRSAPALRAPCSHLEPSLLAARYAHATTSSHLCSFMSLSPKHPTCVQCERISCQHCNAHSLALTTRPAHSQDAIRMLLCTVPRASARWCCGAPARRREVLPLGGARVGCMGSACACLCGAGALARRRTVCDSEVLL